MGNQGHGDSRLEGDNENVANVEANGHQVSSGQCWSRALHPMSADRNVDAVRKKLRDRARTGLRKYGVTTDRTDLSRKEWLTHAQEEAMDLAVYLERLIQEEP